MSEAKIRLEDVGLKFERTYVVLALVFIGLSVVLANILSYWFYELYSLTGVLIGSVIGASVGVLGNFWLLKSNRLVKKISAKLKDKVGINASMKAQKYDKDGNLVEERNA